ncbi:hypothetical protein H5410_035097 [Solanum commersonii]|uniref:Peptidase A1 domain-containing protein n=1 Tax=Solanum commersonii TaxID=4109 RepID=A0A9J5Y099_SOLCO|nr:hypothetical protein H5410_035097 [Solanum commersonii]
MSLDPSKLLDPPMPSYTFAIYHRDIFEKSNFKDYDSLFESRLARSHARACYLASMFEDDNNIKEGVNSTFIQQEVARGGNKIREKVPKTTDGSRTRGILADDVITFVLDHRPIRVTFGCARDQMGQQNFSGWKSDIAILGNNQLQGVGLTFDTSANTLSFDIDAFWGNEKYFSSLNSTFIKQAKERFMSLDPSKLPDPPMPSYAFTIYHRDVFEKSKFKNYDSLLKNRLARCEDRANYIASILEDNTNVKEGANVKIREKVPKSTSVYFAHGEYVASFLLGSSEVKTLLQIDTGSDLVWWQCGPCEANKCYKQVDPLYFPTNSKTYRKIDCIVHGSRCLDDVDKTYKCNAYNNECTYDIRFVSGQRSKGFMGDDVITFVLDHRPIRVTFGCGKDQMGRASFSGYYSGMVGLGEE